MTKMINQLTLQELERELEGMGSCVVLGFDKLTVKEDLEMRRKFADAGLSYSVVKNRMALRAFKNRSLDGAQLFKGKCGVILAREEGAITAAKLVVELIRTHARAKLEILQFRGGVLEGEVLDAARARALADMPDRQGIRTMLAQVLLAPLTRLAYCLNQVGGGLARVINAHNEKLPAEPQPAGEARGAAAGVEAPDAPRAEEKGAEEKGAEEKAPSTEAKVLAAETPAPTPAAGPSPGASQPDQSQPEQGQPEQGGAPA